MVTLPLIYKQPFTLHSKPCPRALVNIASRTYHQHNTQLPTIKFHITISSSCQQEKKSNITSRQHYRSEMSSNPGPNLWNSQSSDEPVVPHASPVAGHLQHTPSLPPIRQVRNIVGSVNSLLSYLPLANLFTSSYQVMFSIHPHLMDHGRALYIPLPVKT